jgi:microcompartment protein CcmL/EutN
MNQSLGMVEYRTVSAGMRAADFMAKAADIDLIDAKVISPGKFVVLFSGELGAVTAAAEAADITGRADQFILGNPHPDVLNALAGEIRLNDIEALGVIETYTAASAVVAADIAAKSAIVTLVDIRITNEMCGKAYTLFTGSVANVTEASRIACARIQEDSHLLDAVVLPNPDKKFWRLLPQVHKSDSLE